MITQNSSWSWNMEETSGKKIKTQKYPFEEFAWTDWPDDDSTWVHGDEAKKAYDKLNHKNQALQTKVDAADLCKAELRLEIQELKAKGRELELIISGKTFSYPDEVIALQKKIAELEKEISAYKNQEPKDGMPYWEWQYRNNHYKWWKSYVELGESAKK